MLVARRNPRRYRLHLFALDVFEDVSLENTRASEKCSALACSLACLIYKSGGNRFPPPKAKDILRITTTPILRSTSLGIVPYWDRPFKGVEAKKSERDYSPGLGIVRSPNRRKASFFCSQTSSEVSFSSSRRVRSYICIPWLFDYSDSILCKVRIRCYHRQVV